ncbi:MAG TPA: cytochrome P450 [Acidimicrobiales bacterium]|nr:cytochrome P450 [Acidimicrobiales bacterium]
MARVEEVDGPDHLDPFGLDDPYPVYQRLREHHPVHLASTGNWLITRYDHCLEVLHGAGWSNDVRRSEAYRSLVEADPGSPLAEELSERSFLFLDPPDHDRLRAVVAPAFSVRAVARRRARVNEVVHALVDALAGAGRFDVVADLALPLSVATIGDLLGVPRQDHGLLLGWREEERRPRQEAMQGERSAGADGGITVSTSALEGRRAAQRSLSDYFRDLLAASRRLSSAPPVISLLAQGVTAGRLSETEAILTCRLLLVAGHETTVGLIGNAINALFDHPVELARLRAGPGLDMRAVDELLRYDSPLQMVGRFAVRDVVVAGTTIPAGAAALVVLGSANRDDRRFPDAERLDVARADNRHLAFGHGVHACIGASLARTEGLAALNAIVHRFSGLQPAGSPIRSGDPVVRSFRSLPLEFGGVATTSP